MTAKQRVLATVQNLPDDTTIYGFIEELYVLARLEEGIAQASRGDLIADENVWDEFLSDEA
ncbi:MAG: hypothetical protein SFX18_13990 [Pirellulales bacterium]|nr:hypothetical protein [Pirellulales bacterium]